MKKYKRLFWIIKDQLLYELNCKKNHLKPVITLNERLSEYYFDNKEGILHMIDDDEILRDFEILGYTVEIIKEPNNYEGYESFYIDNSYVELYGNTWKLTIKDEVIYIREGTWFEQDEKGEWYADWSLSWFYIDEDDPSNYLYYEQDGVEVAVYNFLKMYTDIKG